MVSYTDKNLMWRIWVRVPGGGVIFHRYKPQDGNPRRCHSNVVVMVTLALDASQLKYPCREKYFYGKKLNKWLLACF